MTISTTRSRIRTIGSATLAAAVGLGMGALTLASAAPASAATIDKTIGYKCFIINGDVGDDGTIEVPKLEVPGLVTARTRTVIPDEVAAGATIAETPVQIDIDLSAVADAARITFGDYAKGGSSNTMTHFGINGTDTPVTLQNLSAPWMRVPNTVDPGPEPAGTWVVPVAGTVPAVTIPGTATGTITVDGPEAFLIDAFHNDTGTDPHESTSQLDCSVADVNQLRLGTIQVAGTAATPQAELTGTAAPSSVDQDAVVAFAVKPATATGTVALSYLGKEVGKATLANGAASITIPKATLPTAGTYTLVADYSGDANNLGDQENVTVVRVPAAVTPPPAPPADAKIVAKPKPKVFKVNKAAKLKIAIKSASTSLAGKIVVKVGSKTLGKGKTDDAGKATIKLKKIKKSFVKKGKIKLKVTYGGNATTEKAKTTVKVKVKG